MRFYNLSACLHLTALNIEETELVTNCDRFDALIHSSSLPYAFTEQGIAMLSAVLRSDTAVRVSIRIMSAFVEMRKLVMGHAGLFQRMDKGTVGLLNRLNDQ